MKWRIVFVFSFLIAALIGAQTIVVVIDPGHGGTDPGHKSEKDLNLIVAKKFGTYLTENLKHVTVIYTRTDDSFPSLDERVLKANESKADYFISIHCNGSPNTAIYGTESHVHSLLSRKSVGLAKTFEKEFKTKAGRKSRGVKDKDDREKSLQVLKFTQMTSVLVECGFLTNTKEANFLNTNYGQDIIASALFRGMRSCLRENHPKIEFSKNSSAEKTAKKPQEEKKESNEPKDSPSHFTVQLMSSKTSLEVDSPAFSKLKYTVDRIQVSPSGYKYMYTSGDFKSKKEALLYCENVRKNGFRDAIVIQKKE